MTQSAIVGDITWVSLIGHLTDRDQRKASRWVPRSYPAPFLSGTYRCASVDELLGRSTQLDCKRVEALWCCSELRSQYPTKGMKKSACYA
jgi:hypothetical protein